MDQRFKDRRHWTEWMSREARERGRKHPFSKLNGLRPSNAKENAPVIKDKVCPREMFSWVEFVGTRREEVCFT